MSAFLSAELSATCNALGTFDKKTGKYLIDEFTLNTVKDLIRYLRRDGESHEIRRHFGKTKVLQTDLLPMLIDHWENTELFDVTLRLLVNLTNPALLLYREEVPVEATSRQNYLQIQSHLQSYKEETFTKVETWSIFAKKLTKNLEIDCSERDEDTGLTIERILILIRNVLHIPDDEKQLNKSASVHDQVLWVLNQSGILDIILYMSSENEKQYFMHILEIMSHLLKEQNPMSLADAALHRHMDEKIRDNQELLSLRMSENKEKLNKTKRFSGRHSLFGGTYTVQNMKSISDNSLICLKPVNNIMDLNFSGSKKSRLVRPKNRRPVESPVLERRSAFAVRLFLKEFCIEFLNSSYNSLMHYVKDVLVRAKAQQNDESYYLWAVKFFMEFNRGHNFQVGLVSETMSVSMFHYVQQQMEKYYDMIKVERKKFAVWVRRLHLALRAYKELLNTLLAMDRTEDPTVKESAKVLKSNIFYVLEYREFILHIFLSYDENKMPRCYLVDLVETVHIFLKMLENYCKKTGLVVQKKVRKKNKPKKQKPHKPKAPTNPPKEVPEWECVRPQLAAVLSSDLDNYPPPFDAASELPIDQQKEDCMKKIQKLMHDHKYEDAVGMLRAAREVWPEEGIFGAAGIQQDEELNMLETIYSSDLGVEDAEIIPNENEPNSDYDEDEDEEEEREKSAAIVETDFDFPDFVQRFCHPSIVSACVSLLHHFKTNLPTTNHCAIKMLHRIAWDCKRPSMMFQATLFIIFQRVFNDPQPQFKELEKFAIYIFRKFTEVASKHSKVFIELLFWKSPKDAAEIEYGYDLYSDQRFQQRLQRFINVIRGNHCHQSDALLFVIDSRYNSIKLMIRPNRDKPAKGQWSEEQEEELRKLYMENQANPQTDQDVIDWLLDNLIERNRTRRGVIKKLKDLGLIFKAPTKRSNKARSSNFLVPKEFSEEEDQILADVWGQFKETDDPMSLIMSRMPRKRQKRSYVERLIQLGLVGDKSECRKKRPKKREDPQSDESSSDSASSAESDSDSDTRPPPVANKPKKTVKKRREPKKSNPKPIEVSANDVAKLLVRAVEADLNEGLSWVAECLEEVALDQEAEGYDPNGEGVPLVPIGSAAEDALENSLFCEVLRALGLSSPDMEQETYWRIPSRLHFETIRKRREIIMKALHKELILEATIDASVEHRSEAISSDEDDLFDTLQRMRENNAESVANNSSNETAHESKRRNRKRSRSDDSFESANDDGRKLQKIVERDEDEYKSDDEDILSFAKKTLEYEKLPDTEDILANIPQDDDSDDSENEDIVLSKRDKKRRKAVIQDDSDSE